MRAPIRGPTPSIDEVVCFGLEAKREASFTVTPIPRLLKVIVSDLLHSFYSEGPQRTAFQCPAMALSRPRQVVVVGAGAAAGSFVSSLLRARRATSTPSAPLEVLVFEKDLASDSEDSESHEYLGGGSQGRRAWLGWAWSTGAEFHRSNVPTQSMEYVRSSYAAPRPHHRIRSHPRPSLPLH